MFFLFARAGNTAAHRTGLKTLFDVALQRPWLRSAAEQQTFLMQETTKHHWFFS